MDRLKVLICDDDDFFALTIMCDDTIKHFLKMVHFDTSEFDGIETEIAVNGLVGMKMYDTRKHHVVFTDYNMPRKNGVELLKHIYQNDFKPFKSFLMSNNFNIESFEDALFLHKDDIFSAYFENERCKIRGGTNNFN